ncbi:hypothetical protein F5Y03DRAFT_385814 [Xylaria venustula]|nr:hypothetical protein F5Y03DRAFT_385814 [Xylaria venustula]
MEPPEFAGWAQIRQDGLNTQDRLRAIQTFGKAMADPIKWKGCWEDGGGTSGILRLLSLGSVREVATFCRAIRASNRRGKKSGEREIHIKKLIMALLPQHYPSSELRTEDKRSLQKYYGWMLCGCSSSFELNLTKLLYAHEDMLERRLTSYMVHDGPQISKPEIEVSLREFVFREPPSPSPHPNMSASMQYGLELLQACVTRKGTADRWPRSPFELEVLMSIYCRFTRRSRSADKNFLVKLGFDLMEVKPNYKSTSDASALWSVALASWKKDPLQYEALVSRGLRLGFNKYIFPEILARWKQDPDQYEKLLIQALRQGLGGSAKQLDQDIETASDFTCLANQQWSLEVIDGLRREHAILFLQRLYGVNPDFDFLQSPTYRSIYRMCRVLSRRNFNGDLNAQQRARDEVDRLRKMTATARKQEDRANLAKAAAYYAIAANDLNTYAKTVLWQQRFVHDPLTLHSIFMGNAIGTKEGIPLLSGITLPLVKVANQISRLFNDTAKLAKKAPFTTLEIGEHSPVSIPISEFRYDMVNTIWLGAAELAHSISSHFLAGVRFAILDLLDSISGPSLITACESLVDFAAECKKNKNRNEHLDKIASEMETLSCRAIERLAHTDTSLLSQNLLERAIIQHPEASDSEPPPNAPPKSLIKVTTMKYPQLLNDANFIGPDSAIEALLELFHARTHIDVRLTVLDSLLNTLSTISRDTGREWKSDPTVENTFTALESVILIAGNINERRPMSSEAWAEAREQVAIPATSQDINSDKQHRDWFSLFLAKHGPALRVDILPYAPVIPEIWYTMLQNQRHLLPSCVVNEFNQYVILRMRTPMVMQEINKALLQDVILRNNASVSHWLSIFGEPQPWRKGVRCLNLVTSPLKTVSSIFIHAIINQASVLLDDYESYIDEWRYLLDNMRRQTPGHDYSKEDTKKSWACWLKGTNALAQKLIELLERKMASRADQDGTMLPSTLSLRLLCLSYPDPSTLQQKDEDCHHFVTRLGSTLSLFLDTNEGDMLLWATFSDCVYEALVSAYTDSITRLRLAIHVGDLNIDGRRLESAVQLIKVSVALRLIEGMSKSKALQKPKSKVTPEVTTVGELVRRLHNVMDYWGQRGGRSAQVTTGVRDIIMQWKGNNAALWRDICSWDPNSDKEEGQAGEPSLGAWQAKYRGDLRLGAAGRRGIDAPPRSYIRAMIFGVLLSPPTTRTL